MLSGAREKARFRYDQDWLRSGAQQSFNFLPRDAHAQARADVAQATHTLVADVIKVSESLKGCHMLLASAK